MYVYNEHFIIQVNTLSRNFSRQKHISEHLNQLKYVLNRGDLCLRCPGSCAVTCDSMRLPIQLRMLKAAVRACSLPSLEQTWTLKS